MAIEGYTINKLISITLMYEKKAPAPLVSTSFSFGNRITGNNFTYCRRNHKNIIKLVSIIMNTFIKDNVNS